jgi:hypothetical protein
MARLRRHLGEDEPTSPAPRPSAPDVREMVQRAVAPHLRGPLMGAGRATRNPSDIYPQGERGPDEIQSLIFDIVVDTLRLIPGLVGAEWMVQEGTIIPPEAPGYPYVRIVRRDVRAILENNTSRVIQVQSFFRVYVEGEDEQSRSLAALRVENEARKLLDKQSVGGMTAPALTEIARSMPQKLTGGQENIRIMNHQFMFAYLLENP